MNYIKNYLLKMHAHKTTNHSAFKHIKLLKRETWKRWYLYSYCCMSDQIVVFSLASNVTFIFHLGTLKFRSFDIKFTLENLTIMQIDVTLLVHWSNLKVSSAKCMTYKLTVWTNFTLLTTINESMGFLVKNNISLSSLVKFLKCQRMPRIHGFHKQ